MKLHLLLAVFAGLASFLNTASAQDPASAASVPGAATTAGASANDDDLFNMSLKEVLDVEVSTASKLNVKRTKSPGNMMVVTQDQIRRYGYRNVGEALQRVVGFLTSKLGANTLVGYRGLSPQDNTSNARILFLIDGVRYNEWVFDQAILNERFPLDIESVDRIEVLKGAGSAIWGTNALFAVVNIISKSADSARNDQALYQRDSNNRSKAYASWGDETDGGLKYFTSLSVTGEDGNAAAYYPAFDTPPTANGVARELYEQKGHRASIKMSYDDFYGNAVYGYNDELIGSGVDYLYGDGGTSDYHDIPLRAELGYRSKVWEEQEGELSIRSYYMYDKYRGRFKFPNNDVPGNNFLSVIRQTTQATGTELRYSQNITDELKMLVGTEIVRVFDDPFKNSFKEFTPDGEELYEDFSGQEEFLTVKSYFYDLMYSPREDVSLFFGGRLDQFSGLKGVFGPRASIVVNPNDNTTLRLVYSRGLRNPSIGERLTPSTSTSAIQSEKLNYYEAFAERRISDWLSVTTSLFYSNLSDTIGFASFEDGNQTYQNNPGYTSRGIEVEARAQIDNDLQGYTNFTYAASRNRDGDQPIKSFPHTIARTGISYGESRGVLAISPEIMFASGTEGSNGREFNPFIISNLTVLSYPTASGFNLSATIYNIFDKDYSRLVGGNPGNAESERATEAGREFRFQAKWDF